MFGVSLFIPLRCFVRASENVLTRANALHHIKSRLEGDGFRFFLRPMGDDVTIKEKTEVCPVTVMEYGKRNMILFY